MNRAAYLLLGIVIGVVLTIPKSADAGAERKDPVQLAPQMFHKIFENNDYRVIEYRLAPGGQEPLHSHPKGVLVYWFSNAEMRTTFPDGKITEAHPKTGEALWRDPVTHKTENIGKTEAHALLIEPKNACK